MARSEDDVKTLESLLALSCFVALAVPAQAQAPCGSRVDIVKMLGNKYHERPRALGIANQANLLEVYTSTSGSWTILLTKPQGVSCIIGTGQSWEDVPPTKELTGL